MLTHNSSLSRAEVAEQIIKCGGLAPIVAMVSSEHDVMQNEALIALTIISSTVKGWICCSSYLCVCMWCVEPDVQGCGSNCICEKKSILVQYSEKFMHCFVKFLFVFTFASFFIVMLFYSVVMWRQYNAMPGIFCRSIVRPSKERNLKEFLKEGEEPSWERDLKKNLGEDMFAGQGIDQFLNKIYEKITPYSTTSQGWVIGFCTSLKESIKN